MVIISSCCFVIFSNPLQLLPYADPWLKGVSSCPVEGPKMALDSRVVVEQIFRTVSPSASPLSFPSSRGSFYSVLISLMFWFSPRIEFFASLLCPWFCPWLEGIFKGNFKIRKFFFGYFVSRVEMKRPAPVSPRVSPWVSPLAWGCFSVWPSLVGCWLEGISGSHWRFAVTDLGQSKIALCSALGFQGSISLFSVITSLFILVETGWHGNRFFLSRVDREIDSIRSRVRFVWFRFGLSNAAISRRTIPSFRRRRRRFICVRSASFDVAAANSVRSCGPPKEKLGRGPIKLGRIPEKNILGNIFFFSIPSIPSQM